MSPATLPSLTTLADRLSTALGSDGATAGTVSVVERAPCVYSSFFPSEVVTCRLGDGGVRRFLCKYASDLDHHAHGHRGGVAYEADVYRLVLQPLGVSVPRFYGAYHDQPGDRLWMVVEFLDDSHWVDKTTDPHAMTLAAAWLAHFHTLGESRVREPRALPLVVYDAGYYQGWARRTAQFATRWHGPYPWLRHLCERFEQAFVHLLRSTQTVIHGEFYPTNVLYRTGTIYPVDWESAALGAGEIDLATLTEDWSDEVVAECTARYQQTRWPDGPPADFDQTLAAARLYLLFRWLGDRPEVTDHDSAQQSIDRLRPLGEQLSIL